VIVILAPLLIQVALPGLRGQSAALTALVVAVVEVVVLLTILRWWRQVRSPDAGPGGYLPTSVRRRPARPWRSRLDRLEPRVLCRARDVRSLLGGAARSADGCPRRRVCAAGGEVPSRH
jgi:hypothetical protein